MTRPIGLPTAIELNRIGVSVFQNRPARQRANRPKLDIFVQIRVKHSPPLLHSQQCKQNKQIYCER